MTSFSTLLSLAQQIRQTDRPEAPFCASQARGSTSGFSIAKKNQKGNAWRSSERIQEEDWSQHGKLWLINRIKKLPRVA